MRDIKVKKNNKISTCGFTPTLLLCLFLGGLGAHRFYTKKYISACLQLIGVMFFVPSWLGSVFVFLVSAGSASLAVEGSPEAANIETAAVGSFLSAFLFGVVAIGVIVWLFVDLIKIIAKKFKDKEGRYIEN